jgi:hypothetical protein
VIKKKPRTTWELNGVLRKDLATTYSRGTYRTTTIGNAAFDGRVRDGIGSGHSFMVTRKTGIGLRVLISANDKERELVGSSLKTAYRGEERV